jgi:hypothetical protein
MAASTWRRRNRANATQLLTIAISPEVLGATLRSSCPSYAPLETSEPLARSLPFRNRDQAKPALIIEKAELAVVEVSKILTRCL